MMGLLAGAQLASHLLKLTEGSNHLLPEVFPQVEHIGRFNLTTMEAAEILISADRHLGAMSVPYSLALHEDYLKTCLGLLHRAELCPVGTVTNTKLAAQHGKISEISNGEFDASSLAQLDALRLMRNCMIHDGARANQRLATTVGAWDESTEEAWRRVAPSLRGIQEGQEIRFGHQHLILTLAVTKSLSREANVLIQNVIPRNVWADVIVEDVVEQNGGVLPLIPERLRKVRGTARFHYGALKLSSGELETAIARYQRK